VSSRVVLLLAATMLAAPAARADHADDDRAQVMAVEGMNLYGAKRYQEALEQFKRGYELSQRPGFLFDIGITLQQLKRPEEAREYFKTFLYKAGPSEQALIPKARLRIGEIDAALAEVKRSWDDVKKGWEPELVDPVPRAPSPSLTLSPPKVDAGPRPIVATWVGASVTLVALVAAIGLDAAAWSGYDALKMQCAPDCLQAQADPVDAKRNASIGLFAVAGVAAVATIVAAVIEVRARRR
jgi:tetratricopeptide (TPR) repeat protein